MGLLVKKLTMPFGVEFSDVYFKINRLSYNDEDKKLYFAGAFYVNQAARQDGLQPLENGIYYYYLVYAQNNYYLTNYNIERNDKKT